MRVLVLSIFALGASLYGWTVFESYQEERFARSPFPSTAGVSARSYRHPEANLRRVRDSIEAEEYTDELQLYLEHALQQAPSFYQPSFLVAAYYANRLERPELVEKAFESAIARFPSNGRLHLTYAEWILTPRTNAPYRAYRASALDPIDARRRALRHITSASSLEPNLVSRALDLLVRHRVPPNEWAGLLPPGERTMRLMLAALDRAPRDRSTRREFLEECLSTAGDAETLRVAEALAESWGERDLALAAAERWHAAALERRLGPDIVRSTLRAAHHYLRRREPDRAYGIVRSSFDELEQMQLTEDGVDLLVETASIYLRRRRLAVAESLLAEAATLSPYRAQIYLGLARAHHLGGERDAAISELHRVLELEPANDAARSMLDALMSEPGGADR